MRLRFLATMVAFSLSSGVAFADSGTGTGLSGGAKAASGVVVAGAGAGAVAAVANIFSNSTKGHSYAVASAPEISTSGTMAGLVLLVGGVLVAQGRQRKQNAE